MVMKKLNENSLRKTIRRILREQYDNESVAPIIVDKLIEVGVPDQYAEIALMDLFEIEETSDKKEKSQLIFDFKNEVNRILDKFNIGRNLTSPKEIRDFERKITTIDILIDSLYNQINFSVGLN
jgi:hypothetical protein